MPRRARSLLPSMGVHWASPCHYLRTPTRFVTWLMKLSLTLSTLRPETLTTEDLAQVRERLQWNQDHGSHPRDCPKSAVDVALADAPPLLITFYLIQWPIARATITGVTGMTHDWSISRTNRRSRFRYRLFSLVGCRQTMSPTPLKLCDPGASIPIPIPITLAIA